MLLLCHIVKHNPMLKVMNSLGRKKEEFRSLTPGKVLMYHCGPTVYWNQHIGNMRAMLMGDLIRRSFIYLGYAVSYVRNYTDFGHLTSDADEGEDKMEKAAKREQLDPQKIADKYIAQFEKDTKALNILAPTVTARATHYLDEMVAMVKELLDKGFAYSTPAAIYFDVTKFPDYNKLNGQKLEFNQSGAGFGSVADPLKKHPADFAIWFFRTGEHKNALQYWPSPFSSPDVENGFGFPGWHIECSAMIRKELGKTIDIHMGGIEHIAVHHTNEIAQSESANDCPFCRYWVHNEHLNLSNKKISKSDGNFVLLDELIAKGYKPMELRYYFLQSHYRSKQNFTYEALDGAKTAFDKLKNMIKQWRSEKTMGQINIEAAAQFKAALEDDFNIPKALAVTWDTAKSDLENADKLATLLSFDQVLGLELGAEEENANDPQVSAEVTELLKLREAARTSKHWAEADRIRDELKDKFDFVVVDK